MASGVVAASRRGHVHRQRRERVGTQTQEQVRGEDGGGTGVGSGRRRWRWTDPCDTPTGWNGRTAYKAYRSDKDKQREMGKLAPVNNLCEKCIQQVEWKRKYGKYKKLNTPAKCKGCHGRKVKTAYRSLCDKCAEERKVCPKCMQAKHVVVRGGNGDMDEETLIKTLEGVRERVKRTIVRRYLRGDMVLDEAVHEARVQLERQFGGSDLDDSDYEGESAMGSEEEEEEEEEEGIPSEESEEEPEKLG